MKKKSKVANTRAYLRTAGLLKLEREGIGSNIEHVNGKLYSLRLSGSPGKAYDLLKLERESEVIGSNIVNANNNASGKRVKNGMPKVCEKAK